MTIDRIHTSHSGSLPRTEGLIAANAARSFAEDGAGRRPTDAH
ncbi:hypothetical protein [Arthrobacter sp. ISL-85]|nr:hypothetical protein [Arthrobacter sp. ISL-85]